MDQNACADWDELLRQCYADGLIDEKRLMQIICERAQTVDPEAQRLIAELAHAPGNETWMDEMVLASRGTERAWVKKTNQEAFEKELSSGRKEEFFDV